MLLQAYNLKLFLLTASVPLSLAASSVFAIFRPSLRDSILRARSRAVSCGICSCYSEYIYVSQDATCRAAGKTCVRIPAIKVAAARIYSNCVVDGLSQRAYEPDPTITSPLPTIGMAPAIFIVGSPKFLSSDERVNRQQGHDMRTWQVERRKRTRHLIELGGLVVKAGIVDLTGDDRAMIFGALLWSADKFKSDQGERARALWTAKGKHLRRTRRHTREQIELFQQFVLDK